MAKDPAFLFYSQDFIVGVQTMPFEDRGKYITILCQMHQQGRLDEETIRFLVGSISDKLRLKFLVDEKGLWYNKRLEDETAKRNNFTESRRINGNLGGRPKKEKPKGKPKNNLPDNHKDMHMGNHMGNVNEDVNEIENKLKGAFDEIYLEQQKMKWPHLDFIFEFRTFCEKVRGSPDHYANHETSGLRLALQSQLRGSKGKVNGHSKAQSNIDQLKQTVANNIMRESQS